MLAANKLFMLGVVMLFAGCIPIGEPCIFQTALVSIEVDSAEGRAPHSVTLTATASGSACGCCDGRPDGVIEQINWDFDADGITDATGASVSFVLIDSGMQVIAVTVIDSEDEVATATQTITATGG